MSCKDAKLCLGSIQKLPKDMSDLEIPMPLFLNSDSIGSLCPLISAVVPNWWARLVELFASPVGLVVLGVGLVGLLIGWLLGRGGGGEAATNVSSGAEADSPELVWRHEKLVLVERQQVEKHQRLIRFLDGIINPSSGDVNQLGVAVFTFAEQVREARQKVGTDLSRMQLLGDRLTQVGDEGVPRPEVVSAAIGMAGSQEKSLEKSRDLLRSIYARISDWEESLLSGEISEAHSKAELKEDTIKIKDMLLSLDSGWDSSPDEADRQIRELLESTGETVFQPLCSVVLVDGGETASLSETDRHAEILLAVDRILEVLEQPEQPKKIEEEEVSLVPDDGFRQPVAGGTTHSLNGTPPREAAPAEADEVETEIPAEEGFSVLFCSNQVGLWGQDVYRGERCRARSIAQFPDWAEWISIRRLDTGERIFSPTSAASFKNGEVDSPFGFNGSNELFYGARHLGIYSDACPNEVETRFTYGGWGFGHRMSDSSSGSASPQASGWEGVEIPGDTVFEIAIHAALPEIGELDKVLSLEPQEV